MRLLHLHLHLHWRGEKPQASFSDALAGAYKRSTFAPCGHRHRPGTPDEEDQGMMSKPDPDTLFSGRGISVWGMILRIWSIPQNLNLKEFQSTKCQSDYFHLKNQIESEIIENADGRASRPFLDLSKMEQLAKLKQSLKKYCQKVNSNTSVQLLFPRKLVNETTGAKLKQSLKKYCQKAYKRILDKPFTELREASINTCENPFYVRSFRDRRYYYKGHNRT